MNDRIEQLVSGMELRPGASHDVIQVAHHELGIALPEDYLGFIAEHNGGEGWVGSSYLMLWPIEEIATMTRDTGFAKHHPGLFLFGSDGGGEAYAFDARSGVLSIVEVPYIGDGEEAVLCGRTFSEFLEFLHNRWPEES